MPLSIGSIFGRLHLDTSQFNAGIITAQRDLNLAAQGAVRLGVASTEAGGALAGAGRQAGIAGQGAARLRASQLSLVAAQERYNALLATGTASTARLAAAEATLIRANLRVVETNPAAAVAATGAAATASTGAVMRFGGAMAGSVLSVARMAGAMVGIVGAFEAFKAVKGGAAFSQQMLQIQTQAGASAAEVKAMTSEVLKLAGPVATAPEQLAVSLYHIESVGLRGAKALDVLKTAAMGAKVGNADLEETTNALTSTVASGIEGVKNMSEAMGALNATVGSGDMKLSDLNDALGGGVLTVVKGYGISLRDVGAALATFGDNNIRGANAATMLRMSVQAMAVPSVQGRKRLAELGLQTSTLAHDMQHGGLNEAVLDLKAHLDAAGITGNKVGETLTTVFGKKAGPGIAVLIGQVDRLQSKFGEIDKGMGRFGDAWAATTHTASFAFKTLAAEFEAGAIVLYQKLSPALYEAGKWLGDTLPKAVGQLMNTLTPLGQELATVLVPAWHAAALAIGATASALSAVSGFLNRHKTLVTTVGTAVLGMWAAYRGYLIVSTVVRGVSGALATMEARVVAAKVAVMSMSAVSSLALGGVGVALAIASYAWMQHSQKVAAAKAAVKDYTQAIKDDSGALGEHTRQMVIDKLQQEGVLDAANKLGVSLVTVTDAALGNADALKVLHDAYLANIAASGEAFAASPGGKLNAEAAAWETVNGAVSGNNAALAGAVQAAKNSAAANGEQTNEIGKQKAAIDTLKPAMTWQYNETGRLVQVQIQAKSATVGVTGAMDTQTTAAKILKDALDALNGTAVTLEDATNRMFDAQNAFTDAITSAVEANDAGATSIDRTTAAGLRNRENLDSWLETMKTVAQAKADDLAKSEPMDRAIAEANAWLVKQEIELEKQAGGLGVSKVAVHELIAKLGVLDTTTANPKITPPPTAPVKAALNEVSTKLADLRDRAYETSGSFANLFTHMLNVAAAGNAAIPPMPYLPGASPPPNTNTPSDPGAYPHKNGGMLDPGLNVVGENGAEIVDSRSGRVFTAEQSRVTLDQKQPFGGKQVVMNVYAATGMDEEALAGAVAARFRVGI